MTSDQFCYLLFCAYKKSAKIVDELVPDYGLTSSQFDVLHHLAREKELTQKEIGERIYLSKGNVTQLVTKLEEKGLLTREKKGREKFLSLTAKGLSLYQEILPQLLTKHDAFVSVLTKEEEEQMAVLLDKLLAN